jgi:hypothetical protein
VWEIYLAKTRWNPATSYIAVWTFSQTVKLPFSAISKAGRRIFPHQVSEEQEENEGSVNEFDAHSWKTRRNKRTNGQV